MGDSPSFSPSDSTGLPSNQEALMMNIDTKNQDSDFDELDLTDCKEKGTPSIDIAMTAVNKVEKLMKERLTIAKAREGVVYGKTSKRLPPFMHFNVRCAPDLGTIEDNTEFKDLIDKLIEDTETEFLSTVITHLDNKIKDKTNQIAYVRKEAKAEIGTSSKAAGIARTTMTNRIDQIKDKIASELAEYQTHIRCSTRQNSATGYDNKRRNDHRRHGGYRGNQYYPY